ncbi:MAG: protoheme IX farnesyltransferase [Chloroflexi bacterium]|nr:protoheme IX farnesyltransferase [Chloroflexota bacterium]
MIDWYALSPGLRWRQSLSLSRDLFVLTKPAVALLMVLTAVATAWAAGGPATPPEQVLALAFAGGLTAAGAAALNHYLDRDSDAQMPRTAGRPLPSGRLAVPEIAVAWGLLLCTGGLALGVLMLPFEATLFILLGLLIYVPLYTGVLKRRTPWNVVIGGAAGSCPVLAGWATVRADWPIAPLALAALVFFWTPAHFWAYAMLREEDYRRAGLPMLPVLVGRAATPPYIVAHALATVVAAGVVVFDLFGAPSFAAGTGSIAGLAAGAVVALASLAFLGGCLALWRKPTDALAAQVYRGSNYYLALIFLVVSIGARMSY